MGSILFRKGFLSANNSLFLDLLQCFGQSFLLGFTQIFTATKFGKTSNDKLSYLGKFWVATYEEHISGDALIKHLLSRDSIVAQSHENPADVRVDHHIIETFQITQKLHDALFQQ